MDVGTRVCPVAPPVLNKNEIVDVEGGVLVELSELPAKAEVEMAVDDTLDEAHSQVSLVEVAESAEAVYGCVVDSPDTEEGGNLGESVSQSWPEKTMLKLMCMAGTSRAELVAVTCVISTGVL
jgi:hypothetical protein